MNKLNHDILLLSQGLEVNQSIGGLECPKCNGGQHRDKAFSVSKVSDGVLFHCFRASCGFSGFIPGAHISRTASSRHHDRTFKYDINQPNSVVRRNLIQRFGLHASVLNKVKYSYDIARVLYPVRSAKGNDIGWIARDYPWCPGRKGPENQVKTLSYIDALYPHMHFTHPLALHTGHTKAVLVEDWVSAEKVGSFLPAVALLGSHLSKDNALYLRHLGVRDLIIWLDADAIGKARSIQHNYNIMFNITIVYSKEDPKDLNYTIINNYLNPGGNR
jgi:hypothetical protein